MGTSTDEGAVTGGNVKLQISVACLLSGFSMREVPTVRTPRKLECIRVLGRDNRYATLIETLKFVANKPADYAVGPGDV